MDELKRYIAATIKDYVEAVADDDRHTQYIAYATAKAIYRTLKSIEGAQIGLWYAGEHLARRSLLPTDKALVDQLSKDIRNAY